jgi:hypothetical protein
LAGRTGIFFCLVIIMLALSLKFFYDFRQFLMQSSAEGSFA